MGRRPAKGPVGGADVAILHQVWQLSDKAESLGSSPDAPVLLLLQLNANFHQSKLSNSTNSKSAHSKNSNSIFYIRLFVALFFLSLVFNEHTAVDWLISLIQFNTLPKERS